MRTDCARQRRTWHVSSTSSTVSGCLKTIHRRRQKYTTTEQAMIDKIPKNKPLMVWDIWSTFSDLSRAEFISASKIVAEGAMICMEGGGRSEFLRSFANGLDALVLDPLAIARERILHPVKKRQPSHWDEARNCRMTKANARTHTVSENRPRITESLLNFQRQYFSAGLRGAWSQKRRLRIWMSMYNL